MVNLAKVMKGQQQAVDKEHKESLKKIMPVAEFVLALMHEYKPPMGDITGTHPEEYNAMALKIQQKFLDENLKWIDRHFVFQLVKQVVEFTQETTMAHLDKSFNFAARKLWGDKDMVDITMKDVDEVLKSKNVITLKK